MNAAQAGPRSPRPLISSRHPGRHCWAVLATIIVLAGPVVTCRAGDLYALLMGCEGKGRTKGEDEFSKEVKFIRKHLTKAKAGEVHFKMLLGKQATKDYALDAFAWLKKKTKAQDVALLIFSTHGSTWGKDFHLWVQPSPDKKKIGEDITGKTMNEIAKSLPCPSLWVIDACEAGGLIDHHKEWGRASVLCASDAKHAAFSWGMLPEVTKALEGHCDFNRDGKIQMEELFRFVSQRRAAQKRPVVTYISPNERHAVIFAHR
jgi:hypothetical protein